MSRAISIKQINAKLLKNMYVCVYIYKIKRMRRTHVKTRMRNSRTFFFFFEHKAEETLTEFLKKERLKWLKPSESCVD